MRPRNDSFGRVLAARVGISWWQLLNQFCYLNIHRQHHYQVSRLARLPHIEIGPPFPFLPEFVPAHTQTNQGKIDFNPFF